MDPPPVARSLLWVLLGDPIIRSPAPWKAASLARPGSPVAQREATAGDDVEARIYH
jgi:hypothetical protein